MKIIPFVFSQRSNYVIGCVAFIFILSIFRWTLKEISPAQVTPVASVPRLLNTTKREERIRYRRQPCLCSRPLLKSNLLIVDETSSSLCSHYSTLRGAHQRIIAISMYGPKENALFALNTSVGFLHELIGDVKHRYPGWILRVYHDDTIKDDIICSIECAHHHVDFCNTTALGNLGSLSSYIPAKIWRFLPVGDELVDTMASRDLDSPVSQREIDAVAEWTSSGKAWHAMRDNPYHGVPMLGKRVSVG